MRNTNLLFKKKQVAKYFEDIRRNFVADQYFVRYFEETTLASKNYEEYFWMSVPS